MTPSQHTHGLVRPESLRAVGFYLDQQAAPLCSVAVVPDGILVVTTAPGVEPAHAEALLLTPADLRDLAAANRARLGRVRWPLTADPLVPTGYEDVLRAVGMLAVQYGWTWLRLLRQPDAMLLHHGTARSRHSTAFTAANIEQILELA